MPGAEFNPVSLTVAGVTGGDHHAGFFKTAYDTINPVTRLNSLFRLADFIKAIKQEKGSAVMQPVKESPLLYTK